MRVLIIEDNRNLASGLQHNLEIEGHVVDVAHDGTTGLQRAQQPGDEQQSGEEARDRPDRGQPEQRPGARLPAARRRAEVDGQVDEVAPGDHAEGDPDGQAEGRGALIVTDGAEVYPAPKVSSTTLVTVSVAVAAAPEPPFVIGSKIVPSRITTLGAVL